MKVGTSDDSVRTKKLGIKRILIYGAIFTVICFLLSILQTSNIRFFGQVPDLLLAFICAVGFIAGGEFGAVLGLISGVLISILGGSGFTLVPIVYVACGYFCGALVDVLLSKHIVSFLIFGAVSGIVKEIFTLIFFILSSDKFDLFLILKDVMVGEYFAYLICIVPFYFIVLGIYLLFKGKDEGSRIAR